MLVPVPPKSNTQRQRLFRERHPGYYQQLHARKRARIKAGIEEKARAAALAQATPQPLALPAPAIREPLALPAPPVRLALPAPAQEPLFILPAVQRERERELVPANPASEAKQDDPALRRAA